MHEAGVRAVAAALLAKGSLTGLEAHRGRCRATRDPAAWITRARERARVLVIEHITSIMAIAAALLDHGALDSRQMRDL
jgi:hypothetical protein